jgi:hypothetical protein
MIYVNEDHFYRRNLLCKYYQSLVFRASICFYQFDTFQMLYAKHQRKLFLFLFCRTIVFENKNLKQSDIGYLYL